MTISQHRDNIGKLVITANFFIFILIFILFALNGFTPEELTEILKYLIPIKSIYMTALVKYVLANKKIKTKETKNDTKTETEKPTPLYLTMTNLIIYGHIFSLGLAITLCAFNIISFVSLTYCVAIIETFFGAYVGLIISDMFKTKEE